MTSLPRDVQGNVRIRATNLEAVTAAAFIPVGCHQAEAQRIAEGLVGANLTGHDSHGVVRIPRYLEWVDQKAQIPNQTMKVIAETETWAQCDGQLGFGQSIGHEALAIGVRKAKTHGTAIIALSNTGHLGRIGDWAERACHEGLVSIHIVNMRNSILVAPFGAAERRISTAPIAVGVPNQGSDDFILDFATSRVAEGKVLVAFKGGKPLPDGVLIDENGVRNSNPLSLYGAPSTDKAPNPNDGSGAIIAMGEHKGSGLALACELLAGALTANGTAGPNPKTRANGMLSIYMDPNRFANEAGFAAQVRDYIDWVRAAKPADPNQPVMVPGDPERQTRAERLANGVPLPEEVWESIVNTMGNRGINPAIIDQLAN